MTIPRIHLPRFTRRVALLLALSGLALGSAGCAGGEGASGAGATDAPSSAPAVRVATEVAARVSVPLSTTATGSVEPWARVMPGTKILGRVERVPVREGDRVERGDVLAELESRDLEAAVAQAEAAIAMSEAQLENARSHYERMVDLHSRGSVTDKNLEDALAGHRVAEAGVQQARANLQAAEVTLSYATIRSPVSGFVVEKRIEAGDVASPGVPLFVVEDLSQAKIVVQVPETDIVGLAEGDTARVHVDVLGLVEEAAIARVVPSGDRASRTFDVEIVIDNDDARIKSGMFARVSFPRGEREVLALPDSAVVARGQLQGVFVVEADEIARLHWVRLGPRLDDGRVEVLSGLSAGEEYVIAPPASLVDGARVTKG
jgi:RND family efflux transporter MFP subunit